MLSFEGSTALAYVPTAGRAPLGQRFARAVMSDRIEHESVHIFCDAAAAAYLRSAPAGASEIIGRTRIVSRCSSGRSAVCSTLRWAFRISNQPRSPDGWHPRSSSHQAMRRGPRGASSPFAR